MNIWKSFKKWALKPEPLHHEAVKAQPFITLETEPEDGTPYWMRDPEIGEPVKSIMKAFVGRPSRFKLTAEWTDQTNGHIGIRGKVVDSVTGESFNYSQYIKMPTWYVGQRRIEGRRVWNPLTSGTVRHLQIYTGAVIPTTDLNVDWMTPRERSLCISIAKASYVKRITTAIEYERERAGRAAKKAEREVQALQEARNAAERTRLIEIYKGE